MFIRCQIENRTFERINSAQRKGGFRSEQQCLLEKASALHDRILDDVLSGVTQLMNDFARDLICSRSICAAVRDLARQFLLFDLFKFMRSREFHLSKSAKAFQLPEVHRLTVSLLSDPVYPTHRVCVSPLTYAELSPSFEGLDFPSAILPQLSVNYQTFEALMPLAATPRILSFSAEVDVSDLMISVILAKILAQDVQPELVLPVALLYGMDPIPGLLLKFVDTLFFVEGLSKTATGMRFRRSKMNSLVYSFYFSYFIKGYFGKCFLFTGHPVLELVMRDVIAVSPHWWLHQQQSLEANFRSGHSFVLVAENQSQFQELKLLFDDSLDANFARFPPSSHLLSPFNSARLLHCSVKELSKQWSDGSLDNFTYLCLLNRLGGRSVVDFSQYFVFPWTIVDFFTPDLAEVPDDRYRNLSLPMGQIGGKRIQRFDSIFEESGREYFYGTHYMHLGVVLFYLVRLDPFRRFSVYFHHGWDHPNRVFFDLWEAWTSASAFSPVDVKEIIPQLVCLPEFFMGVGDLPFTHTLDGRPVSKVTLPQWSTSPRDFVFKMRQIFEGDLVSHHLHNWIDLIFGYKSRGDAAAEAKNLYHKFCYASVDRVATFNDPLEREAYMSRIINFGQCAQMLFKSPHVARSRSVRPHLMSDPKLVVHQRLNETQFRWPLGDIAVVGGQVVMSDSRLLPPLFNVSVEHYSQNEFLIRKQSGTSQILKWDKPISLFKLSFDGSMLGILERTEVFSLYWLNYLKGECNGTTLCSTVRVGSSAKDFVISVPHFLVVFAVDCDCVRFDFGLNTLLPAIPGDAPIVAIAVDDRPATLVVGTVSHVVVRSINGDEIGRTECQSPLTTLAVCDLEEGAKNRFFVTGHEDGVVRFWAAQGQPICLLPVTLCDSRIERIVLDVQGLRAVAVTSSTAFDLEFCGSSAVELRKEFAIECYICAAGLEQKVKCCAICHRFFCKNCGPDDLFFVRSMCQRCAANRRAASDGKLTG
jgi:hypothetical protein